MSKYKKSNALLANFAHIASHDLKSPIRTIKSYSQLLKQNISTKLNEEENEFLEFISVASGHMNDLVDNLLKFSKINSTELSCGNYNLEDLLLEVISELDFDIKNANCVISYKDLNRELVFDRLHIKQLLQNLIGNAIKFRNKEVTSKIEISMQEKSDAYKISVKDNGIGIKEEYRDYVFKIFKKLHAHTEFEGTGIGLAICKLIVSQHQGEIWVESNSSGGSTFFFEISKHLC